MPDWPQWPTQALHQQNDARSLYSPVLGTSEEQGDTIGLGPMPTASSMNCLKYGCLTPGNANRTPHGLKGWQVQIRSCRELHRQIKDLVDATGLRSW